jgi:hypothetical protein
VKTIDNVLGWLSLYAPWFWMAKLALRIQVALKRKHSERES